MKKTITITAKANQRERTFTLRCYNNGKMYAKYRTTPMTQEEFDSAEFWTESDWKQFLTTDEYCKVK
jgi:hypothetical protein